MSIACHVLNANQFPRHKTGFKVTDHHGIVLYMHVHLFIRYQNGNPIPGFNAKRNSDVNKDWTCKDKDKDLTHKDKDFTYSYLPQVAAKHTIAIKQQQ